MIVELDEMDSRLRPGMNTTVRVAVDRVADVVLIPARAVFEKEGRSVADVRTRTGWTSEWSDCAAGSGTTRRARGRGTRRACGAPGFNSRDETMTEASRKRIGWSLAGVVGVALLVAAITVAPMQGVQSDGDLIPTARVAEGDVPVVVHASGELKPMRAQTLVAPSVGGPMQILSIEATGTPVKAGDVVVEFDSEQEERLVTAKSELAQAEQEIVKMQADAVVQRAQDEVTLLRRGSMCGGRSSTCRALCSAAPSTSRSSC